MPWIWGWFRKPGSSGFTSSSTAEDVTQEIDATGLTAIVTGGTSGIGTYTVRVLDLRGARVIMPARNMESGHRVKEVILKENPNAKVDVMELDLSSLNSVRKFSASFKSLNQPLNILMGNGMPFLAFRGWHRASFCNQSFSSTMEPSCSETEIPEAFATNAARSISDRRIKRFFGNF